MQRWPKHRELPLLAVALLARGAKTRQEARPELAWATHATECKEIVGTEVCRAESSAGTRREEAGAEAGTTPCSPGMRKSVTASSAAELACRDAQADVDAGRSEAGDGACWWDDVGARSDDAGGGRSRRRAKKVAPMLGMEAANMAKPGAATDMAMSGAAAAHMAKSEAAQAGDAARKSEKMNSAAAKLAALQAGDQKAGRRGRR